MIRTCPSCNKQYTEYPALSRKDNKTEICPKCGQREALEAWYHSGKKPRNFKLFKK